MPVNIRQQRLFAVLNIVLESKPKNEVSAWDAISAGIKTASNCPAPVGNHPSLIRRDVIHGSGYKGQAELTFAVLQAVQDGHCRVFGKTLPPNAVEALNSRVKPVCGDTRAWFDNALKTGIIKRLVHRVAGRLPREDRSEIESTVNLCVARWCAKDSFKEILATGQKLAEPALATFIWRSHTSVIRKRGVDAHCRGFMGAKTASERQDKPKVVRSHEDAHRMVPSGKDADGEMTLEPYHEPKPDMEVDLASYGSIVLDAVTPGGGKRRSDILAAVLDGKDRQDLMRDLGLSPNRVNHLMTEIRDAIKTAPTLNTHSLQIANVLRIEPWSSVQEIAEETGLDRKEVKMAMRYMSRLGLVKTSSDEKCYALTTAGQNAEVNLQA